MHCVATKQNLAILHIKHLYNKAACIYQKMNYPVDKIPNWWTTLVSELCTDLKQLATCEVWGTYYKQHQKYKKRERKKIKTRRIKKSRSEANFLPYIINGNQNFMVLLICSKIKPHFTLKLSDHMQMKRKKSLWWNI